MYTIVLHGILNTCALEPLSKHSSPKIFTKTMIVSNYCMHAGCPEISKKKDLPRVEIPLPSYGDAAKSLAAQKEIVGRINKIFEKAGRLYDLALQNWNRYSEALEAYLEE